MVGQCLVLVLRGEPAPLQLPRSYLLALLPPPLFAMVCAPAGRCCCRRRCCSCNGAAAAATTRRQRRLGGERKRGSTAVPAALQGRTATAGNRPEEEEVPRVGVTELEMERAKSKRETEAERGGAVGTRPHRECWRPGRSEIKREEQVERKR